MAVVNYDLYPSPEEQLPWLRYYLECKAKAEGKSNREITDRDVERLYVQANSCACVSHWCMYMCVCVWGGNRMRGSDYCMR